MHIDNKGKDILILGEGPTQRLDDTTLTAKTIYRFEFLKEILLKMICIKSAL